VTIVYIYVVGDEKMHFYTFRPWRFTFGSELSHNCTTKQQESKKVVRCCILIEFHLVWFNLVQFFSSSSSYHYYNFGAVLLHFFSLSTIILSFRYYAIYVF